MTDRIRTARAAVDAAAEKRRALEHQLDNADAAVSVAKMAYGQTARGEQRVADIIRIINVSYGGDIGDLETAKRFAPVLFSAAMWARSAMPGSKAARVRSAIEFVAKALPIIPGAFIERVARELPRFTNADAARALGITWEMRCHLGLRMIGASDLNDTEYRDRLVEQRKESDRVRKDSLARAEGRQTIAELRSGQESKRLAVTAFALQNEVAEKTVRNWISRGKVVWKEQRENEFRTSILIYAETSFPEAGKRPSRPREARETVNFYSENECSVEASANSIRDDEKTQRADLCAIAPKFEKMTRAATDLVDQIKKPLSSVLAGSREVAASGGFQAALRAIDLRRAS